MEKADLFPAANFRRKTAIREELLYFVVNFQTIRARFHFAKRKRLSSAHRFPQAPLVVTRAAAHNRSGHVAEVTALRVPRKDIENDQRIRFQWPRAALMRIARLITAGHDRVRRQTARAQNR